MSELIKKSGSTSQRMSGVDLLRIIGIILIFISHLSPGEPLAIALENIEYDKFISTESSVVEQLIYSIYSSTGTLGNAIFFTCSAWFLLDKKETNYKKAVCIITEAWMVSVVWLVIVLFSYGWDLIGMENVIRSLFPTFFSANWYVTCYLVFCFISPYLNLIIEHIDKRKHFVIALTLFVIYFVISFVHTFSIQSYLIVWIAMYFIIAYFKLYMTRYCDNIKSNVRLLGVGILGGGVTYIVMFFLARKFPMIAEYGVCRNYRCSPFFLFIAFGALNIARCSNLKSKFINYISSLSLLIYVTHDNLLFRQYIRPQIWQFIYLKLGFDAVLLWHIALVILILTITTVIASIYKLLLQKFVFKLADCIHNGLVKIINKIVYRAM